MMRILCGTILASVAAVVCAAEAKGYSLADEQARATPDWFRKGVMYQIQPRAFTPEGTIEYYGVRPHGNTSGPISNAAILQLAATTPNFLIHEMMLTDGSFRKLVTNENVKFEDGYLVISDKPGFGIDVNVEEIKKRPYTPRNLRHYTGTLTDIRPKGDTFCYFDGFDCERPYC